MYKNDDENMHELLKNYDKEKLLKYITENLDDVCTLKYHTCECGKTISQINPRNYRAHLKSKYHLDFIKNKKEIEVDETNDSKAPEMCVEINDNLHQENGSFEMHHYCINKNKKHTMSSPVITEYEQIECECGAKYNVRNKSQHLKSNRHIAFLGGEVKEKTDLKKCECGKTIRLKNLESHLKSKYHLAVTYKEEEYENDKITCECGGKYNKGYGSKAQHEKTKMHKEFIKNKNEKV